MGNSIVAQDSIMNLKADFNKYSVDTLFQKYAEIGFLYPEKLNLLKPFFSKIKSHWKILKESPEELLMILTLASDDQKNFSSVSLIKQSNYGILAQHLVSDGNPFLSLKVMLDAQYKTQHLCTEDEIRSGQNWFRPNNRYAYRIFSTMVKKLGDDKAYIKHYDYLHMDLESILPYTNETYRIEEVEGYDSQLIEFVKDQYSNVFVRAEELDQKDILLNTLNHHYKKYGLSRYRRICKIIDQKTNQVKACIIANRSPIGLNFSFLENRCYYITDNTVREPELFSLLSLMNNYVAKVYDDFELGKVPIVTDQQTSLSLQTLGAEMIRVYVQTIWLREGFSQWYEHIHSFLSRIEAKLSKVA
ncbi:hypothetical protein N9L92_01945 [Saprospiraceae bacterium]|nr:hypothetical protein [Saprospiraceae bacterium]